MKNRKLKIIHIITIFVGSLFILLPAFHANLWFDETYSIAISNYSLIDIWKVGSIDVHPVLYYWLLHLIILISKLFHSPIIMIMFARLFSSIATILLGIIGYTHIRRDFGEKVGLIFTFLVFFMPTQSIYSSEIRMYSWLMLLVTLTAIYAYRISTKESNKNWLLFTIFSLMSAYTHYYGLMSVAFINLFLLIYLLKKKKENVKKFLFFAIIQLILYLPWLFIFFRQLKQVSNGFWITFSFPKTIIEVFEFQFTGNHIRDRNFINSLLGTLFGVFLIIYTLYCINKQKNKKAPILAFSIYLIVFFTAILISLKSPILYPRYMLAVNGLFYFYLAFSLTRGNKYITIFLCLMILLFGITTNSKVVKINYDSSNMKQIEYVKENIKQNNILVYSDIDLGSIYSIHFPKTKQYFYNQKIFAIESYKVFQHMETIFSLDPIDHFSGTIWLIDTPNYELLRQFQDRYLTTIEDVQEFNTEYQSYLYRVIKLKIKAKEY